MRDVAEHARYDTRTTSTVTAPDIQRLPLTAAVLAGGRSLRMGVDKTLLDVDGRALVSRVVDAVGERLRTHARRHEPPRRARGGEPARGRAHPARRGRLPGSARRVGDRARRRRPMSGCSPSPPTCRTSRPRSSPRCGTCVTTPTPSCPSPRRASSRCSRSTASRRVCRPRARFSRPAAGVPWRCSAA